MRLKKPTRATIDQVRITREGNDAIVDYADAGIAGTRLTIGPDIATMTDREVIDVFNGILAAQGIHLRESKGRNPKAQAAETARDAVTVARDGWTAAAVSNFATHSLFRPKF
jgi:hypothetical protein